MTKYVHFDGMFAKIATVEENYFHEVVTTAIRPDSFIRIDHGRGQTTQLTRRNGRGGTLVSAKSSDQIGKQLARDLRAVLCVSEAAYEKVTADARAKSDD